MWKIPLKAQITNLILNTLFLNGPTGQDYLNFLYYVLSSAVVLEHIELCNNDRAKPSTVEAIQNIYEIPSIEQTIRYLHAASGLLTKSTWIKSIRNGNYLTWTLITVTNVYKHFPYS